MSNGGTNGLNQSLELDPVNNGLNLSNNNLNINNVLYDNEHQEWWAAILGAKELYYSRLIKAFGSWGRV